MTEYRLHGPPGCGKTHALSTRWVPRAVDRFGEDSVLVASLTKTAAVEIAARLPIPRDRVGTLHSHAFRALGSPQLATGKEHLERWNRSHAHWQIKPETRDAMDSREEGYANGETTGSEMLAEVGVMRHRMIDRSLWPAPVREFDRVWRAWKQEHDLVDFDDMIERAYHDVTAAPGAPDVLIVDEAQDCSKLELALVRKWAEHADHVVLAGDADQAIFDWRGADAQAFLGSDLPEENNYKLTQSYRVPRAVHARAREWISRASLRYVVEYMPRDADGLLVHSNVKGGYGRGMLAEIERSLDRGGDVMVIASCGYMLNSTMKQLREAGIAYHNPYRPTHGGWNPCGKRGGVGRLAAFLAPCPHFTETPHLWTIRELERWVEIMDASALPRGAKRVIADRAREQRRRPEVGSLTRQALSELLGEGLFTRLGQLVMESRDNPLRIVSWFRANLMQSKVKTMQFAFNIAERHGLKAVSQDPRVIIGSIHSVKGGEADHVHLLPDLSSQGYRGWMIPGPKRDSIIRQFYVAMTRARESLVIHRGSGSYAVNL